MAIQNDRKGAIKKLKLLAFSGKSKVEAFRSNLDERFKTIFNPNGVECSVCRYGKITCDVLAPEIYSSNRIMLYIHGGSFVGGSRAAYRSFCSSLATKCYSRVIVPEYRLAPEYPYPAANEDIQNVFKALVTEEQIACSLNNENKENINFPEITIAADGSAASIACSLILNLRDKYRRYVKNLILFSPWLNLSSGSDLVLGKKHKDEIINSDVLRKSSLIYTYDSNTGNPFVSPLLADEHYLRNFPCVFIQMGEKEILLDNAKRFRDKLIAAGNKCILDVWHDMMFMFQMAHEYLNESHLALDRIGEFITSASLDNEATKIDNIPKLENGLMFEA